VELEFPPIGSDPAQISCYCCGATIAFFIPRRLAICIVQALSHDHFLERSMACLRASDVDLVRDQSLSKKPPSMAELDLITIAAFLSRLRGSLRISAMLNQRWPTLASDVAKAKDCLHTRYPGLIGTK
jgi:hypothetical protein